MSKSGSTSDTSSHLPDLADFINANMSPGHSNTKAFCRGAEVLYSLRRLDRHPVRSHRRGKVQKLATVARLPADRPFKIFVDVLLNHLPFMDLVEPSTTLEAIQPQPQSGPDSAKEHELALSSLDAEEGLLRNGTWHDLLRAPELSCLAPGSPQRPR